MENQLTVVLVGDAGCGKTSLLLKFLGAEIPEDHQPTNLIVEEYVATVEDSVGNLVNLIAIDTAGGEDYDRYRPIAYGSNPDAIILCFAVDDHESLINVEERWKPTLKNFCPSVPTILVGNKIDVRNAPEAANNNNNTLAKTISAEIGKLVQQDIEACAYFECSSRTGECVPIVFDYLAKRRFLNRTAGCCTRCVIA